MATSPYFNHHRATGEQDLYEDLLIESIQLAGVDVYYLPATRDEVDPILGESVRTSFRQVVPIEIYMPDGGMTGGDGELMSKFGYTQRDSIEVVIAKRRFLNAVAKAGINLLRPRKGDLIFIGDIDAPVKSQVNEFFEITYLNFTDAPWNFGKTMTYKLSMSSFIFSHETFDTSSPLDATMTEISQDLEDAVNTAVKATKQTLLDFDKKNPLGNL